MGGRFKRGDIDIHMADALHCTVETGTTLWSNYPLIKKNIIIKQVNFNEKKKKTILSLSSFVIKVMLPS